MNVEKSMSSLCTSLKQCFQIRSLPKRKPRPFIHPLRISHNTPRLPPTPPPPKNFVVSNLCWVLQSSQEKLKTILMPYEGRAVFARKELIIAATQRKINIITYALFTIHPLIYFISESHSIKVWRALSTSFVTVIFTHFRYGITCAARCLVRATIFLHLFALAMLACNSASSASSSSGKSRRS